MSDTPVARQAEFDADDFFVERWSPRALSGAPVSKEMLMILLEAARWAPSGFNNQPWRFLYAHRDTPAWPVFLGLLVEFNRSWAERAGVLIVVASKTVFDHNGKPSRTHSFDTGAAWQNLALQASLKGLVAHGMEGFDYEKAKKDLNVPDEYNIEAMIAIGHPGRKEDLPAALQAREVPSPRKKVSEIAFEGGFPSN
jgi:nitroreductase